MLCVTESRAWIDLRRRVYRKSSVFISSSVMLFNDQQGEANEELFVLENDGLGSLGVS